MEKKKNIYYYGMNAIAPGIGQFMLKRWLRGTIQLGLALFLFIWTCWEMLRPLLLSVYNLLFKSEQGAQTMEIGYMYLVRILIPLLLLLSVWIWSYIDLAQLLRDKARSDNK